MNIIKYDFKYRGQHFAIVYDGKFYMTVNHKFIGEDGRLIKELHFNDGLYGSDTLDKCILLTKQCLDIQYYEAQGMSKAEAFSKAMNIPLELVKHLF